MTEELHLSPLLPKNPCDCCTPVEYSNAEFRRPVRNTDVVWGMSKGPLKWWSGYHILVTSWITSTRQALLRVASIPVIQAWRSQRRLHGEEGLELTLDGCDNVSQWPASPTGSLRN